MKIGIDFGTTRIVVAAADRGNYPVAVSYTHLDVYKRQTLRSPRGDVPACL